MHLICLGENYNDYNLYKEVFPISCKHPTLAVVSVPPTLGPYPMMVDNVSRWAARVFAGRCHLPEKSVMRTYLEKKQTYYRQNCEGRIKVRLNGDS